MGQLVNCMCRRHGCYTQIEVDTKAMEIWAEDSERRHIIAWGCYFTYESDTTCITYDEGVYRMLEIHDSHPWAAWLLDRAM